MGVGVQTLPAQRVWGVVSAQPDRETLELALRMATAIQGMRAESRFNLTLWLMSCEGEMGGTLVLESPHKSLRRAVPEARYASHGFTVQNTAVPGQMTA